MSLDPTQPLDKAAKVAGLVVVLFSIWGFIIQPLAARVEKLETLTDPDRHTAFVNGVVDGRIGVTAEQLRVMNHQLTELRRKVDELSEITYRIDERVRSTEPRATASRSAVQTANRSN